MINAPNVVWKPHPGPQTYFLQCPAFEVLYGGAVGGGKSVALLADFIRGVGRGHGTKWRGVIFRRNMPDMEDIISKSMEMFRPLFGSRCFNRTKSDWNFPDGEKLSFRSLEHDKDLDKVQGQEYSWIGWDELTQWESPYMYTYLMSRLRSSSGPQVRVRAATNPGGAGHSWVKARFIDIGNPGSLHRVETRNGEYFRCFIPAKLEDNPTLMQNDPNYADRIYEISDPVYAQALREGRWDLVEGAKFTEWNSKIHVVRTQPIPRDAVMVRMLDWGRDKPYACYWVYMDEEARFHVARELYGYGGAPDVGTKEDADIVRDKIIDLQRVERMNCPKGYVDGSVMDNHGSGDTVYDLLSGSGPSKLNWEPWPKGSGSRVRKIQMLHSMMKVVNGDSRFVVEDCCRHLIRTLPIQQRAKNNPEDVDTNGEDHALDAIMGGMAAMRLPDKEEKRRSDMILKMDRMEGIQRIRALPLGGGW